MSRPPQHHTWPTPQQVAEHLSATRPEAKPNRTLWLLIGATGLMVLALTAGPSPISILLPWVLLMALAGYVLYQRSAAGAAQRAVRRVGELTMLRHHDAGLRDAWKSLGELRKHPGLYVQAALLLSANLMATRRHEAALAAQDQLLETVPPDHPVARVVAMQRVMSLLHEERLADADAALRRSDPGNTAPLGRAMSAFARLYQSMRTNQFDQIVESPERLPQQLRPLGLDAGYGYGMVAAAMHAHGRHDEAARWWKLATLLLPASTIMNAIEETRPLAATPPARSLHEALREDGLA